MQSISIGEAARQSGVKVPTIRYYEQIGLLSAPARSEGNRRSFEADDLRRLVFIRHARDLGFEVSEIRTLLALQDDPNQSCDAADSIAQIRLADVVERIRKLEALKATLESMIESCHSDKVRECRVIEALADCDEFCHSHREAVAD